MRLTERFTRTAPDTLQYSVTIDDPQLGTRPWTMSFPPARDNSYGTFEYACHEGNWRTLRGRPGRAGKGGTP